MHRLHRSSRACASSNFCKRAWPICLSHNFGVVEYLAHDIAVMKDGKLVEYGAAEQVLGDPQHRYTQALLRAVPRLARRA